jgi:hypothetical protein
MKKALVIFLAILAFIFVADGALLAQCQSALGLAMGPGAWTYFVRMAVHFGDATSIPTDIMCCRSLLGGEHVVNVPIWAYNIHEGIDYIEFAVESNESLGVFIPDNSFQIVSSSSSRTSNSYRLNLILQSSTPMCGPARIGYAEVVRVAGYDPAWIDITTNADTGRMVARDMSGGYHSAFSPQHGGYIGRQYLYSCQDPICEEPNTPVTAFDVRPGGDCRVKVLWTAGSGNYTMIRWSTHRFPVGIEDGHLAAEIPTVPGQSYYLYHVEIPTPAIIYYTAFSYTRDASGLVIRDSFVECSSVDWIAIKCEIGAEETSWGKIKSLYR